MEFTQQTQLTPDESSNLLSPCLSPPPEIPWGRLVPCVPSENNRTVDFFAAKSEYWLGRSNRNCELPIPVGVGLDPKVNTLMGWAHSMISNRHCRIQRINGQARIEDASGNGTLINNSILLRRGEHRLLHSGDEICLVNPSTLRKKQTSERIFRKVLEQYTFIFVQSKPRRPCVNPRAMNPHVSRGPSGSPKSGRRVETHYDIREVLGDGTSGQVRRAIHRQTGQEYAVKIISLRRRLDTANMEQEVSLLQDLDHPYIVQLFDVFVHPGVAMYLVMELVAGGDLFDRIVEHQRYSAVDARRVMRRLLSAIHYLHNDCNIVHRDLKPENILCASPTDVKLADFGLAKIMKDDGLKTFCGTPAYFAPEVLQRRHTVAGEGRYGKPADMWSLGVVLYILLTGKPPFGADMDDPQELDFSEDPVWGSMPQAQELVTQLLRLDSRQRLTVKQACDHPWINIDDGDTHVHPLDDPAVSARKQLFPDKNNDDNNASLKDTNGAIFESSVLPKEELDVPAASRIQGDSDSVFQFQFGAEKDKNNHDQSIGDIPDLQSNISTRKNGSTAAGTTRTMSIEITADAEKERTEDDGQALETRAMSVENSNTMIVTSPDQNKNLTPIMSSESNAESPKADVLTIDQEKGFTEVPKCLSPTISTESSAESPKADDVTNDHEEAFAEGPKSTSSPDALIKKELSVTPSEFDNCSPPHSPPEDMNLNERSNRFREQILEQANSNSPGAQPRSNNQTAVTPNVSNVTNDKEEIVHKELLQSEDDIISQFSSEPSSLESFPESPVKEVDSNKRSFEENTDGSVSTDEPGAKRQKKHTKQTTLISWFIKKK